jgi:hypothetical protein
MSTEIVGGPTTADVSVASTGVIVEEDDDGQGWILDAYRSLEPGVSGDERATSARNNPRFLSLPSLGNRDPYQFVISFHVTSDLLFAVT